MNKILIANRGEIACRVIRTARKMGISTVAVYSEPDRDAPHVRLADEAVFIGPAASSESYLRTDKIIEAAKETGAEGIHPGYGFLSENASFAKEVTDAGITFIGPKPYAIEIMGSKLAAKDAVSNYDIPMVPGTDEAVTDIDEAIKTAEQIGFPILVKASAGGGGKGMRIVEEAKDFKNQMERAISEAESAFGDGSVFIEKFVTNPRHIEFQILADEHGNIVHLFERECSVQRRHQKVVEEAPSVLLTEDVREAMGQAAVRVAKACDYTGAGTVEFLVDSDLNFYFLEMNTRLQVEHPVTEIITGLDLVEQQIRIARGEKLAYKQEDLGIKGHALELRVYAESPEDNFMPSTGTLSLYRRPEGDGIRLDDGYDQGMDIPIYYDPMIAKLITYGDNRMEAISRMIEAIGRYDIEGVATTLPFGRFVCEHEAFRSGNFDTGFVKNHYTPEALKEMRQPASEAAALFVLKHFLHEEKTVKPAKQKAESPWFENRR
ncbi:MAG: acetyl-CoA carboxylase biotin carboxylase subunit [Bacteroidetes bacterium]|nr:acetyl-CoA carboxylase biotin carboxylase subunit [Bacteroidota bacterium]